MKIEDGTAKLWSGSCQDKDGKGVAAMIVIEQ
jgi:hypothetical protein